MPTKYKILRRPSHPLARGGLVSEHRFVLYETIGPGSHPCHWCGRLLNWLPGTRAEASKGIHVDHLDDDQQNNDPANLVPSCKRCNWGRSGTIRDDELFVVCGGRRRRAEVRHCAECGADFLHMKADRRPPPRGLYCSRSCAAKVRRRQQLAT